MSTTNYGNPFQVRVLRDTTYWLSGSIITVRQIMDQGYEDVYEDSSGRKIERKDTCELIGIPVSTTNHTPGPWSNNKWNSEEHQISANGGTIALISHSHSLVSESEADANARLIAAAPEMLEACKMALVQIQQDNDERKAEHRGTEWQLKAAIEKAQ